MDEKNSYTETIPAYESEDERKFLKSVGDNEAQMIVRFWEETDIEAIFKAAGMILGKKKIYICGRGISFLLAKCMVDYLYGCNCFASAVNTELNEEVYGVLSELNEDAIMVAVSFPLLFYDAETCGVRKEKSCDDPCDYGCPKCGGDRVRRLYTDGTVYDTGISQYTFCTDVSCKSVDLCSQNFEK